MSEKRPTNSELALRRLEEEDSKREDPQGILELFEQDEDAPLARDDARDDEPE
jgi:hypothetical protein